MAGAMSVPCAISGLVTTYSAVVTTGIYCRPGCGARPLAENVRTFELAAGAEAAGFRACLRCRPYRVAGPVASSSELVCRAVQLIIEGVLDEGGEAALAARLAVSSRHLRRMFHDHLGATPDQLARSRRAHFARRLLDDSDLPIADVAFASGFGSLRQFNRDMRAIFRAAPAHLRSRRRRTDRLAADGGLVVRVPFGPPYDWDAVLEFLTERAVPGVESVVDGVYRRTISLDGGPGMFEVWLGGPDHLLLRAHLPYWEGLIHVVERAGRVVGVSSAGGGPWGLFEASVFEVLRADHGTRAAREAMGTLSRDFGQEVSGLPFGLRYLFPGADMLASVEVPEAVRALSAAVSSGSVVLDHGVPPADLVEKLRGVVGTAVAARIGAMVAGSASWPPLP
jgi:AraC family transcriptional regulator of adaptative response / DNA-3-methyladenine glycosylase II